ncbi:MAG: glycosyltransferase family 39 protein [Anaerolineales bacterium]|nr:glycosyltransferase family 39 protein [Anaerolineales bacterium]
MGCWIAVKRWLKGDTALLIGLAMIALLFHLVFSSGYGYFRDEFYYLAASHRLDFGYLEYPAGIALITALTRVVLGESLLALRFLPAVTGSAIVLLAGLMARELGGKRFAQGLAALAVLAAPVFRGTASLLTMDVFDQLCWVLCATLLIRILRRDERKTWLWFGLAAGLGLEIKVTILYFGLGMVAGLLVTPARTHFKSRWFWLGGGIALLLASPYVAWQVLHNFPTLEFWREYAAGKTYPVTPLEFLFQQIITLGLGSLPLWLAGLYHTLVDRDGRALRPLGVVFLLLFFIFMFQQAKFYFLAAAYPMLFAAGALWFERLAWRRPRWYWTRATLVYTLIIGGLLSAPLALPILPVEAFIDYNAFLGGAGDIRSERLATAQLPQNFADRFGWSEKAEAVWAAYAHLSPEDQARACIFTGNYGQAGALEFFGPDLPPVISGHNNYYLWGPGDCSGEVILTIGIPVEDLTPVFATVEPAGVAECDYCMPYEDDLTIYLCRDLAVPLDQAWPMVKHYD